MRSEGEILIQNFAYNLLTRNVFERMVNGTEEGAGVSLLMKSISYFHLAHCKLLFIFIYLSIYFPNTNFWKSMIRCLLGIQLDVSSAELLFTLDVDISNFVDDNTQYISRKNLDKVIEFLEQTSVSLFQNFLKNPMKGNADKCHFCQQWQKNNSKFT